MNDKSLQWTRIVFRMSEWRHRDGIQYGGRFVTCFNTPRQSEMTSTLPDRSLCCLLTLSRIRCMASRPRSSPLYAFATNSASERDPTIRPRTLEHSMTNAAEHMFGYNSRIYNPSVTEGVNGATGVVTTQRCLPVRHVITITKSPMPP